MLLLFLTTNIKFMDYNIRLLQLQDEVILWKMLMLAAHETSLKYVQSQPYLARYVQDWGRVGDMGFIASSDKVPIGSAWLRLWSGDNRGFGYIDDETPELAIAVVPKYRGKGVGTRLLFQVMSAAQDDFPALSLSVRSDNPVVSLYKRMGFLKVEGSEVTNQTGSISFNMLKKFS